MAACDVAVPCDDGLGAPEVEDAAHAVRRENTEFLKRWGFVVVRNVVDPAVCDCLREHVLATTDEASRQERRDLFGDIQEQGNRWDLKLDLCEPVVAALNGFAEHCGPVLEGFMSAKRSEMKIVELAAISSDPGAKVQPVHADTVHGVTRFLQSDLMMPEASADAEEDEDDSLGEIMKAVATDTALICSALVALQDVDEAMGPTHVWPGTNTVEHHNTLVGLHATGSLDVRSADAAFRVGHQKMCLSKGDLVLYDSRTMHCGGANFSSASRRSVLVISTMSPGIRPDGSTWTMLPSLQNRLHLGDFPLGAGLIQARTNTAASVELPDAAAVRQACASSADAKAAAGRPIPPVDEWQAAVQCGACEQWRPVGGSEALGFVGNFLCKEVGFACSQPQGYTVDEINAALTS